MSIPHFLIIPSLSASIHTVVQPSTWFFQELFFFSYFLKIFISLFSHSGSSLLLRLCSSWGGQVLLSSCSMLASRCIGFSCGTRALGCVLAQQLWHTDSTAPRHTGSSWTRNRTHVSCIGRQVLYHRTTREARSGTLFFLSSQAETLDPLNTNSHSSSLTPAPWQLPFYSFLVSMNLTALRLT